MPRTRELLLLLAVATCACSAEGTIGERGDESDARYDVAREDIAYDTNEVAIDTGTTDSIVEEAETIVDAFDAGPHVCPALSAPRDCSKGTGTGTGDECKDGPSCFLTIVQKAVNDQVSGHPDWFDFVGPGGCPVIKNVNTFLDAVVAAIDARSLCVERDPNAPDEEITVKKNNAFSENFDIVSSAGCARSGAPIYTGFCAPAWW